MKRTAPYRLTKPCAKCPFRCDVKPYLTMARVREMEIALDRGEFHCHETLDYQTEDGEGQETERTAHCAGALILLEKMNRPSQMMRICERIGMYDRRKLDMAAPVFDSWDDMREAQRTGDAMGKHKKEKGKSTGTSGPLWPKRDRDSFPGHFQSGSSDGWAERYTMGGRYYEQRGLKVCIFCGNLAAGLVQGHAACSGCKRLVTKMLSTRSRTVRTKHSDAAVLTWESLHGRVAMGTLHVEVIAGPNGGRVNVEIVKGDREDGLTPRASRFNILRPDTARAVARFLLDAAELAENTPATSSESRFAKEPADKDRVPAKEPTNLCGLCKIRPATVVAEGLKVCEKCRADVVIDADNKQAAEG